MSRDKAMHGMSLHVGVYSKDDTMAYTRRLVVISSLLAGSLDEALYRLLMNIN